MRSLLATLLVGSTVALLIVLGPAASRALLDQRDGPGPDRPGPVVLSGDTGGAGERPTVRRADHAGTDRPRPPTASRGPVTDVEDDEPGPAQVIVPAPRDWDPDDDEDDDEADEDDGDDG